MNTKEMEKQIDVNLKRIAEIIKDMEKRGLLPPERIAELDAEQIELLGELEDD